MTNDEPLNRRAKSHEVLRQTGFETTFTGRGHRLQSRGRSAKPRTVRGSWHIESLRSRFETKVLAGRTGFKMSVKSTRGVVSQYPPWHRSALRCHM